MRSIVKKLAAILLVMATVSSNFQMNLVHAEEQTNIQVSDAKVNYVYVESPYLKTPETQNIVISWRNAMEEIQNPRIVVEREDGMTEEWKCEKNLEHLYLFSKQYSDVNEKNTYKVVSFKYIENDVEKQFDLSEMNASAEFGVNKEYKGYGEHVAALDDSLEEVKTSIVTIDGDGNVEVRKNLPEAIDIVQNGEQKSGRLTEVVVALDPGHDDRHGGASANGLIEQTLTLKIANYCKKELEEYGGVRVHMTRTTNTCPYPTTTSSAKCIEQRAIAAAREGAKIFVSFHLNSGAKSAMGAEVIFPNANWKPEVGADGKALAQSIQKELVKLGLKDRGIYSKDTTTNERYPDNSKSDYFSVQIYNKEHGIPGIIVEHAFMSNSSEANKFLKTEVGLKSLGVADATGIAKYLGLSKVKGYWELIGDNWKYNNGHGVYLKNEWIQTDKKWYYVGSDGYRLKDWQDIGQFRYYFNDNGEMTIGWLNLGGEWYYFGPSGNMLTGWQDIGKFRYYFDTSGKMSVGWQQIGGKKYYFGPSGNMYTGTHVIEGKTYHFDKNGVLQEEKKTGWEQVGDAWYYYNQDGTKQIGWKYIGASWYYFDDQGKMSTGWRDIGEFRYFFGPSGNMYIGWQEIGGKKYYFGPSGNMYTGTHVIEGKTYHFDKNGVLQEGKKTGWEQVGDAWYYYNQDGTKQIGWKYIGIYWYYFDNTGKMSTGWRDIGEFRYYFGPSGNMYIGWQKIGDKKYYFGPSGNMYTGTHVIEGKTYYFDKNGVLQEEKKTGWEQVGDAWYYYNQDGTKQIGWKYIGIYWYYFDTTGKMSTGWSDIGKFRYFFGQSGNMYIGWQEIEGKKYYFGPSGNMYIGWKEVDGKYYYFDNDGVLTNPKSYAIMGNSEKTKEKLVSLYKKKGYAYPSKELGKGGASTIEEFCQIYMEEAKAEGIKVEVAFAQAMLETRYLQFGGDVSISQFNFAGIGATGNGEPGNSFPDVRTGIRAQIQHLKAYATDAPLNQECVDPRYQYVNPKGCAPYVEWLGQKENPSGAGWATAKNYGINIVRVIKEM